MPVLQDEGEDRGTGRAARAARAAAEAEQPPAAGGPRETLHKYDLFISDALGKSVTMCVNTLKENVC